MIIGIERKKWKAIKRKKYREVKQNMIDREKEMSVSEGIDREGRYTRACSHT